MAAVIVPSHTTSAHLAPAHGDPRIARPARAPERARPPLRVIDGGRSAGALARQRVYHRRRLVVGLGLVVCVGVLALAVVGVRSLVGAGDPGSRSAPSSSAATAAVPPAAAEAYVVQPGDTLWSIAAQLPYDGDVRALVDELADRAGGPELQAGQRIELSGLAS
jgi:LysM repeat protein